MLGVGGWEPDRGGEAEQQPKGQSGRVRALREGLRRAWPCLGRLVAENQYRGSRWRHGRDVIRPAALAAWPSRHPQHQSAAFARIGRLYCVATLSSTAFVACSVMREAGEGRGEQVNSEHAAGTATPRPLYFERISAFLAR